MATLHEVKEILERLCQQADRMERMLIALGEEQQHLDTDVSQLTAVLADFATEWQALSAQAKAAAPQLNFTKLDALANQAQVMDAAWKAQTNPPETSGVTASDTTGATGTTIPTQGTTTGITSTTTPDQSTPAPGGEGADTGAKPNPQSAAESTAPPA